MRVASRRLRAALALFKRLPAGRRGEARPELAWLGRTIGAVRDLDVQLAQLDEWVAALPPAGPRAAHAPARAARATSARARARRCSRRSTRRGTSASFGDSAAMLRTRTGGRTRAGRAAAPDLVERRHRAVRKASKRIGRATPIRRPTTGCGSRPSASATRSSSSPSVYPGETQALVRRTVELQDLLGELPGRRRRDRAPPARSRADRGARARARRRSSPWARSPSATARACTRSRDQVPSTQAGLTGKRMEAAPQAPRRRAPARHDESRRSSRSGDASPA